MEVLVRLLALTPTVFLVPLQFLQASIAVPVHLAIHLILPISFNVYLFVGTVFLLVVKLAMMETCKMETVAHPSVQSKTTSAVTQLLALLLSVFSSLWTSQSFA